MIRYVEATRGQPVLLLTEDNRFPRHVSWVSFMVTGMYVFAVFLAGAISGGVSITREYEQDTLDLTRLSPGGAAPVLAAKTVAACLYTAASAAVYLGLATALTDLSPWHWPAFGAASVL